MYRTYPTVDFGAKIYRSRLQLVIITFVYILVNIYNYCYYLTPVWGYQGFPEVDVHRSLGPLISAIAICITFSVIYPKTISVYSRFVVWFLFYFVFVPSIIIVSMQGYPKDGGYLLITCLTISLFFISYIPELCIKKGNAKNLNPLVKSISTLNKHISKGSNTYIKVRYEFTIGAILMFIVLIVLLFLFYSKIITIVDIRDVYGQREIVSEFTPNRTLEAYALQWLLRDISPFMIAVGIMFKQRVFLMLGIVGMGIGFFITGSKFIVFTIPLMYAVYFFVLNKEQVSAEDIVRLFCGTMIIMLIIIGVYGEDVESLVGLVTSQIVKRAFSINGMTLGNYYDFFINNSHPFTFYSHLGPVGWFIDYPYGEFSIGQVVGHYQAGVFTYDMSAGFWSTDGIAAAGYVGILFVGIILGIILLIFNYWSRNSNLRLLCLSSLGCIWMLADTSLFRVLLSGGWPLHFLLVYFYLRSLRLKIT